MYLVSRRKIVSPRLALSDRRLQKAEESTFDVYLFKDGWIRVGNVTAGSLSPTPIPWFETQSIRTPIAMPRYRVVTARAPPFVQAATKMDNGSCLNGMPCLQVKSLFANREITLLVSDFLSVYVFKVVERTLIRRSKDISNYMFKFKL